MKKEFEAYYAKAYAWIFAVLILLFLFGIIMFSIFWIPNANSKIQYALLHKGTTEKEGRVDSVT